MTESVATRARKPAQSRIRTSGDVPMRDVQTRYFLFRQVAAALAALGLAGATSAGLARRTWSLTHQVRGPGRDPTVSRSSRLFNWNCFSSCRAHYGGQQAFNCDRFFGSTTLGIFCSHPALPWLRPGALDDRRQASEA